MSAFDRPEPKMYKVKMTREQFERVQRVQEEAEILACSANLWYWAPEAYRRAALARAILEGRKRDHA